jgi:alkanesulfonate monooxygenase SsuD/methylene tetrahydromethanopterin reductase-like flavin-dependent oxidoreductase (luciferase family)
MKVGVLLPLFSGDPAKVLRAAREAEDLGFDGVFAFDHFFPPGGSRDAPALEAFTTLAGVSAVTERIRIGTLVARASIRPTGLLAKTAAWLDAASDGRLILGIGTGDPIDRPEHDAFGLPHLGKADRRVHLEETLRALRAMFQGRSFPGGEWVAPLEGPLRPASVQPGGPPIWVGGQAEEVIRIAGRLADGWNGWGSDLEDFAAKAETLRDASEEAGRSTEPTWAGIVLVGEDQREAERLLGLRRERGMEDPSWWGSAEALSAFLAGLGDAGATWAAFVPAGPPDRRRLVGERVLTSVRG